MGDMTDSSEITELPPLSSSLNYKCCIYWIKSSGCFVLMSSLFISGNQGDLFDVKLFFSQNQMSFYHKITIMFLFTCVQNNAKYTKNIQFY